MWIARNGTQKAVQRHNGIQASSIARAEISCTKIQRSIGSSFVIRWVCFQSLSMSSKRENFAEKVKKQKYYLTGQLKKKYKKNTIPKKAWWILTKSKNSIFDWLKNIIEMKKFVKMGFSCGWKWHSPSGTTKILRHKNNGSFTAYGSRPKRMGCVKTTPHMTRLRDAKVCNNLATDEIDEHRIQFDYKECNIEKENSTFGIAYACWKQTSHVTTKTQSTFNTKNMKSAIPQFVPLVWFLWSWLHTTSWLKFHLCGSSHGNHIKGVLFYVESSIPFHFLIFPFIHNLLHILHLTRLLLDVVTLRTSPEGKLCGRILLPHRLGVQELRPHGDSCRVLHRVPDPPTVIRAKYPSGCGLRWHSARKDAS